MTRRVPHGLQEIEDLLGLDVEVTRELLDFYAAGLSGGDDDSFLRKLNREVYPREVVATPAARSTRAAPAPASVALRPAASRWGRGRDKRPGPASARAYRRSLCPRASVRSERARPWGAPCDSRSRCAAVQPALARLAGQVKPPCSPTGVSGDPWCSPASAGTSSVGLMSMRQPVSFAARRAFWPSLPIASES